MTEKTHIIIRLLPFIFTVLSFSFAFYVWAKVEISVIEKEIEYIEKRIDDIDKKKDSVSAMLISIKTDVEIIKYELGIKK